MNLARRIMSRVLGKRLPTHSGEQTVEGISAPVTIGRDSHGVPHIEAETDNDAWFAVGYCQGQDRGFQLMTLARAATGRLSEWVGAEALPIDQLTRRIGFGRTSVKQLNGQTPDTRGKLEAFAQGVNEGISHSPRPHELTLLRQHPTPFLASDILAIGGLNSFLLASNWDVELARLMILDADGPEAVLATDPQFADHLPTILEGLGEGSPSIGRLADDIEHLLSRLGGGGGSNNWVLGASRTATGRPLLANDPHLAPMLPAHWYLVHVKTPDWEAAGACFAGSPCMAAGHNGHSAWGVTAALIDNTDLFCEEVGDDQSSVRVGDSYQECEVILETIHVKGQKQPTVERVLVTRHGPIISPAMPDIRRAISIRATWLHEMNAAPLMDLARMSSFDHLREILSEWPGLALSFVYGDETDTIGWQLAGTAPRRKKGNGTIPMPGWDEGVGWEEKNVPFEEMPSSRNPASGQIATANNQPTSNPEATYLGVDWLDGYRAAAIHEALAKSDQWDLDNTGALHCDTRSLPWRDMREPVLKALQDAPDSDAQQLLTDWDGDLSPDSPAAALFEFFFAEMTLRCVRAKTTRSTRWALGKGFSLLLPMNLFGIRRASFVVRLLHEQPKDWFHRSWQEEITSAAEDAYLSLKKERGGDQSKWGWGHVRPLTLMHTFGVKALLAPFFNLGPIPFGGDANTIQQAAAIPLSPSDNPRAIPSLRMIIDIGNWDEARFALPGGQSGNPCSPHYDDQLSVWVGGHGVPIAFSAAAVKRSIQNQLVLSPSSAAT